MKFFFDRNGFFMELIVFILISSSNCDPEAVKLPFSFSMFNLQLLNHCDESNCCYTKVSNLNYLKMRRSNFDPNLSIGIFNLRFRIEFMCDIRNCVTKVKDPYNRVIISEGNKQTTNNEFSAILGFSNSCNYQECEVILFDMLNWNNRLITKKTLRTTSQNSSLIWCSFNFNFSHSYDDLNCTLNVRNSRGGEFIIVNMMKSDVKHYSDGKLEILGFVFFVYMTAFVIYFIRLSYRR